MLSDHTGNILFLPGIAAMMLVVLYRDRVVLDPQHWIWEHYRPFKWWLLPNAVTGALALFLGPLQFSGMISGKKRRSIRFPFLGPVQPRCVRHLGDRIIA